MNPKVRVGELWQTPAWIGPCAALLCPASKKTGKPGHCRCSQCIVDAAQDRIVVFLTCIPGLGQIAAEGHRKDQAFRDPHFFFFKAAVVLKIFCKQFERLRAGATVLTVAAKLNRQLSRGL